MVSTAPMGTDATGQPIASIRGIGTALPEHWISQSDSARIAQELGLSERWHDTLPALYRRSGVQRRHSVLLQHSSHVQTPTERQSFYQIASPSQSFGPTTSQRMHAFDEHAAALLTQASMAALENADVTAQSITHLVTVSCSGFSAPGVDLQLIRKLGLSSSVQRTNVGFMGCHGAINGLRIAKAIAESDPKARVLLGAVELCSLHQQYSDDPQQLVANALFADGAASLIVEGIDTRHPNPNGPTSDATPLGPAWRVQALGAQLLDDTMEMMSWRIGNHGFEMSLSPQVPAIIASQLRGWLEQWLGQSGLKLSDIEAWAIHPGGPRIVAATGEALGLSDNALEMSYGVLADYGNMSSPTVLFILQRWMERAPQCNSCVMLAFGPGLCIEAALLVRP